MYIHPVFLLLCTCPSPFLMSTCMQCRYSLSSSWVIHKHIWNMISARPQYTYGTPFPYTGMFTLNFPHQNMGIEKTFWNHSHVIQYNFKHSYIQSPCLKQKDMEPIEHSVMWAHNRLQIINIPFLLQNNSISFYFSHYVAWTRYPTNQLAVSSHFIWYEVSKSGLAERLFYVRKLPWSVGLYPTQ